MSLRDAMDHSQWKQAIFLSYLSPGSALRALSAGIDIGVVLYPSDNLYLWPSEVPQTILSPLGFHSMKVY